MPSPTNKKKVQSFIYMIQLLNQILPLDCLSLQNQSDNLQKIKYYSIGVLNIRQLSIHMKKEIPSAPFLAYYNPKKANYPADRCQHQRSQCLSTTRFKTSLLCEQGSHKCPERLCGDLSWNLLQWLWAMEKFHNFLYASHFLLETDQKLIETILSKSLN